MPRKPNPDVDVDDDELEQEEEEQGSDSRKADIPFDPWGDEEETNDRRRDPLRSPV
ncbi:MAG TPA: hypothetical protein VGF40_17295 [Thermoanaerobaculia bacterium]